MKTKNRERNAIVFFKKGSLNSCPIFVSEMVIEKLALNLFFDLPFRIGNRMNGRYTDLHGPQSSPGGWLSYSS